MAAMSSENSSNQAAESRAPTAPAADDSARSDDADTITPSGFAEIEKAFDRVSLVADALIDSINDDSLRGKERSRQKRAASQRNMTNYVTDSDDDVNDEPPVVVSHQTNNHNENDNYAFGAYQGPPHHHFNSSYNDSGDDVSTLGDMTLGEETDDGSLVHDVQNLKSSMKAMQAEMIKEEEAFHANVTSGNGKDFFQKLEEEKEADAAAAAAAAVVKTPRMRNVPVAISSRPTTINVRKKRHVVPVMKESKPSPPSLLDQFKQLCNHFFGKRPNIPLILLNIAVWLVVFRIVYVAKHRFMDAEGMLFPLQSIYTKMQ